MPSSKRPRRKPKSTPLSKLVRFKTLYDRMPCAMSKGVIDRMMLVMARFHVVVEERTEANDSNSAVVVEFMANKMFDELLEFMDEAVGHLDDAPVAPANPSAN